MCWLCGEKLPATNPYSHFTTKGCATYGGGQKHSGAGVPAGAWAGTEREVPPSIHRQLALLRTVSQDLDAAHVFSQAALTGQWLAGQVPAVGGRAAAAARPVGPANAPQVNALWSCEVVLKELLSPLEKGVVTLAFCRLQPSHSAFRASWGRLGHDSVRDSTHKP